MVFYCISDYFSVCVLLFIQSLEEKEKGNAAYKQKDFTNALLHYEKAAELDPSNITILTNRAGNAFAELILLINYSNLNIINYFNFYIGPNKYYFLLD